ncbi:ribbon-helix-helix protein, CopG family [Sphingobium nicotianae]|uniref:Ribbon-helix-helix protein, CopG family n=1 Tax=Sphingobium nicotianae TaxID=2782607 RepID=A0A9X1DDN2_9SPHN|nr:ribbon-helix-helix protein, CopG family [Sphingobium nicotianae]MBT2188093.1 ribbon-helix-helix protein, CopG family [Sphingobium nicotianae]
MRFLADLSDEDVKWLDARAAEEGKSRAAVLREAVGAYRAEQAKQGIERYFGLWARHGSSIDGLDYERRMRGEWDRDWDGEPAS